jgi:quercetin dioxygenase-like cupin family protein
MTVSKLKDFTKGWIIGDFEPSLYKSKDTEVGVRLYAAGDVEKPHFHKVATEFTVIVSGKFKLNDNIYSEGDIITIEPDEISYFSCLESGKTVVVKIPSVPGDKYLLNEKDV